MNISRSWNGKGWERGIPGFLIPNLRLWCGALIRLLSAQKWCFFRKRANRGKNTIKCWSNLIKLPLLTECIAAAAAADANGMLLPHISKALAIRPIRNHSAHSYMPSHNNRSTHCTHTRYAIELYCPHSLFSCCTTFWFIRARARSPFLRVAMSAHATHTQKTLQRKYHSRHQSSLCLHICVYKWNDGIASFSVFGSAFLVRACLPCRIIEIV